MKWSWQDRVRERLLQARYGAKEERAAPTRRICMLDCSEGRLRLLLGQASKHKTPQGRLYRQRMRLFRLRLEMPWLGSPCSIGPHQFDHDWAFQDESFDHEYGTEQVFFWQCARCDERMPVGPGDTDDEDYREEDYVQGDGGSWM